MEDKALKSILQTLVDENISPAAINVWPGVKERLVARNHPLFRKGASMKPELFSHRRAPLALMTAILILFALVALLVTPPGRALAQQILLFFNRTNSNTLVIPTVQASLAPANNQAASPSPAVPAQSPVRTVSPAPTEAGCGSPYAPRCQVEQVQPQVDFPVHALTRLPDDVRFVGATFDQGSVMLTYQSQGTLMLIETPEGQDAPAWQVSNDASVQSVTIGGLPGEYVQGGWVGLAKNGSIAWDATLPTQTLRWAVDGIRYTLSYTPGKVSSSPHQIALDQLVALAAGIQPVAQADLLTPTAPRSGLQDIQAQAGFAVIEPAWLPERFVLRHAAYNTGLQAACLYYDTGPDDIPYPLVIAESAGILPAAKDLRPVATYEGKVIAIPGPEELITVRGADGKQGTLASNGLDITSVCGGESLAINTALLWQSGGRSFIIFGRFDNYMGEGYVTRMEMIRMAETLNGMNMNDAGANPRALDPERMLSARDADTVTGVHVLAPTKMLTSLHLDHISYPSGAGSPIAFADGWPGMIATLYTGQFSGIVGDDRILILQVPQSEWTLAQRELEGGYTADTVRGQPAIYKELCWQAPSGPSCQPKLIWLEGESGFEVQATFSALLPKATFLEIVESMR